MVISLTYNVPNGIDNVDGSLNIMFGYRQLKITHLSIESRWHLSLRERHWKVGKERDAIYFKIVGKVNGVDNRTWSKID